MTSDAPFWLTDAADDKITPEDAAKRDAKEVADEFRDEIGKRISELTHDIPAEIATLRAAVEKAEWERDDAIATIKLLQQQLKIQNDSFVDRLSEATRLAVEALRLLGRYRTETPLGHQPHMIAHEVDAFTESARAALDRLTNIMGESDG